MDMSIIIVIIILMIIIINLIQFCKKIVLCIIVLCQINANKKEKM